MVRRLPISARPTSFAKVYTDVVAEGKSGTRGAGRPSITDSDRDEPEGGVTR